MGRTRQQMIDAKGMVAVGTPALTPQAVHTAKIELIAQPQFVRTIIAVATRTVTTDMPVASPLNSEGWPLTVIFVAGVTLYSLAACVA